MVQQILISAIIIVSLGMFLWGKLRYDIVAFLALFLAMILGLVPLEEMFAGFIHPVVILIISMVVISKGLTNSGIIDIIARHLKFAGKHPSLQIAILVAFTAFLSAFINSMGALAFVIPIAMRMARQSGTRLSMFLIPIAFASHFGGSFTLIGNVSNIIVSGFRAEETIPFGFFDFATVSFPLILVGICFIALIGWRLVPKREDIFSRSASLERYTTEIKVPETSPIIGKTIRDFRAFTKEYFTVSAILRGDQRISVPSFFTTIQEGDVVIIEAEKDAIEAIIAIAKLELVWKKPFEKGGDESSEVVEVAVPVSSSLIGETAKEMRLHHNYGVNVLALHRPGMGLTGRVGEARFRHGDVLIIQGYIEDINRFIRSFDLFSLKEREFRFEGRKERALLASGIFAAAVVVSVFNVFPIHIVFAIAALAIVLAKFVSPKEMYGSVNFSMIVLLAVMLQLGFAFQDTGVAATLASSLFLLPWEISPTVALAIIFVASIWLSDILSNTTVAVLLAPVAISTAHLLGVSVDPFLIAVAIGSASSYLTPIGHQSNIFVMGIGGYKFTDYWRLGLPLEILTFVIGLPLILYFWAF
jgi:di/tricarboxylate transporter